MAAAQGDAPGGAVEPPETPVPHSRLALADDQVKRWRGVIDTLRSRTDLAAKALAGVGSTVLGAVGIAKFGDVFPFPEDWNFLTFLGLLATVGGFALVAAAVAGLTMLLARVSAPVFTSARLEQGEGIDDHEFALIKKSYDETARLNGAPSLQAYEARAHRFARLAERAGDEEKPKLEARATLIHAEVQAAQGRAAADVIRRRASEAFTGERAQKWYAAAVVGVILFAVGADYLDGERSGGDAIAKTRIANNKERVAVAKECAATVKAYRDVNLESELTVCPKTTNAPAGTGGSDKADEPSAGETRAGAVSDLATRYAACQKAAAAAKDPEGKGCRPYLRAIDALAPDGG